MKELKGEVVSYCGFTHSNKNHVTIEVIGEQNYFGNILKSGNTVTILHSPANTVVTNHPLDNILVRLDSANRDGLIDLFDSSMDRGMYAVTRFGKYYGMVDGSFNCYITPPENCVVMTLQDITCVWNIRRVTNRTYVQGQTDLQNEG